MANIESVPSEVITIIIRFLDFHDILNACKASKHVYCSAKQELFRSPPEFEECRWDALTPWIEEESDSSTGSVTFSQGGGSDHSSQPSNTVRLVQFAIELAQHATLLPVVARLEIHSGEYIDSSLPVHPLLPPFDMVQTSHHARALLPLVPTKYSGDDDLGLAFIHYLLQLGNMGILILMLHHLPNLNELCLIGRSHSVYPLVEWSLQSALVLPRGLQNLRSLHLKRCTCSVSSGVQYQPAFDMGCIIPFFCLPQLKTCIVDYCVETKFHPMDLHLPQPGISQVTALALHSADISNKTLVSITEILGKLEEFEFGLGPSVEWNVADISGHSITNMLMGVAHQLTSLVIKVQEAGTVVRLGTEPADLMQFDNLQHLEILMRMMCVGLMPPLPPPANATICPLDTRLPVSLRTLRLTLGPDWPPATLFHFTGWPATYEGTKSVLKRLEWTHVQRCYSQAFRDEIPPDDFQYYAIGTEFAKALRKVGILVDLDGTM